ncbi:MAG TPA: hypothetical protein VFP80_02865 [Thermoanaerobaculia bacterium]|nr:hypothetical protein [Thermoanaerobaculia bacterium]
MNWKKHLLRSSVPLEYEAARILAKRGLSVSADYPYSRSNGIVEEEGSVDVRGVATVRLSDRITSFSSLDFLVECKYRERGTTWLFLPKPGGGPAAISDVLQYVDYFSSKFVHGVPVSLDTRLDHCFAAAEIRDHDRSADEGGKENKSTKSQLRHGLRQLQYAVPALIALRARSMAYRDFESALPFFFVPILLTNADLIIANVDFGISKVEQSDTPENLGKRVSCLIWSAELGPDFDIHCQRHFAIFTAIAATTQMKAVEAYRRSVGESASVLPSRLASRIASDGKDAIELAMFSNILVVNIAAFEEITEKLCAIFEEACASFKDSPIVRWSQDGKPTFPWSDNLPSV